MLFNIISTNNLLTLSCTSIEYDEIQVRACWYMFESTLESRYVRSGIVMLINCRFISFDHFDRKLEKAIYELERHYLPIKIRSIHIIKPRSHIFGVLKPLLFFLMGRRLRSRSQIHSGSTNQVMDSLIGYGMTQDVLPNDVGGDVTLDHHSWLAAKRERESRQLQEQQATEPTNQMDEDGRSMDIDDTQN